MPILKVSKELKKEAMEVIRLQITVLGDCPQCRGQMYRSGVCEDCGFISPEVMEAIKDWQESQGITQKAAYRSLAFTDMFPTGNLPEKSECPDCGKQGFNIQCENPQCGYEEPPMELNHTRPKFTGIDQRLMTDKKHRFIPTAEVSSAGKKIEKNKDKLKKKKKASVMGEILADDNVASSDKVTRGKNLLQEIAQQETLENLKNKGQEGPKEQEQR